MLIKLKWSYLLDLILTKRPKLIVSVRMSSYSGCLYMVHGEEYRITVNITSETYKQNANRGSIQPPPEGLS